MLGRSQGGFPETCNCPATLCCTTMGIRATTTVLSTLMNEFCGLWLCFCVDSIMLFVCTRYSERVCRARWCPMTMCECNLLMASSSRCFPIPCFAAIPTQRSSSHVSANLLVMHSRRIDLWFAERMLQPYRWFLSMSNYVTTTSCQSSGCVARACVVHS